MDKQVVDHIESIHDTISHGALVGRHMFLKDLLIAQSGSEGLTVYKLKDKIPESLTGRVTQIKSATCEMYLQEAQGLGLLWGMKQVFPIHYRHADFDQIEIGYQTWQPKLDVLTARFDALDLVNSLDQERVDAFVTALGSGGDAFALIDQKVLVETVRAQAAEVVVADALATEIIARAGADTILATAVAAVQSDVDQNESDADAAWAAEQVRAQAAEVVVADALATEIIARTVAVAALQTDVDQNESDADAAWAAEQVRAQAAEVVVADALATEIIARAAAVAAVQTDVDQNESDADAAISAEQVRAQAAEVVVADALATEIIARAAAITQEVSDRDGAISTAVASLIDSAPGALDTLNELAAAMADDASFSSTVTSSIALKRSIADSHPKSYIDDADNLRVLTATYTAAAATQDSAIGENTAKVGYTDARVALAPSVVTNSGKLTFDKLSEVNTNSAKVGFTDARVALAPSVVTNSGKLTFDKLSEVTTNSAKVGFTDARVALAPSVVTNSAKLTFDKLSEVTVNSAKLTFDKLAEVTANSAKVTYTEAKVAANSAVVANSAKLTFNQLAAVTLNNAKVTYTEAKVAANSAVVANSAKLTFDKLSEVTVNSAKATFDKASEVTENSAKVSYSAAASAQVAANVSAIAGKVGTSGNQTITQAGAGPVLQLTNTTADQMIFRCWGADGQTYMSGGNVIHFTRNGGSSLRAPESGASINIEVRGQKVLEVSDAVRCTQDLILEQTVPANSGATGSIGSIRVDATHIYVCTAANTWKRVAIAGFT